MFYAHKGILCKKSPFFNACLNSNVFAEGKENTVRFEEDKPDVIDLFLAWVYGGSQTLSCCQDTDVISLVGTYVFADRLCIEELKNSIVSTVIGYLNKGESGVPVEGLVILSHAGLERSMLRGYLHWKLGRDITLFGFEKAVGGTEGLRSYIQAGGEATLDLFKETISPTKFLLAVSDVEAERYTKWMKFCCQWHEHKDTETCIKTSKFGEVQADHGYY